jgi:hypothetical protein
VRMQQLHLHIVVRCPDVDATIMEMSRLLSSPTVCIHLALAPLAVFRSKIWIAKIHCSISFVFGNNCPIID